VLIDPSSRDAEAGGGGLDADAAIGSIGVADSNEDSREESSLEWGDLDEQGARCVRGQGADELGPLGEIGELRDGRQ